jgi:hypothetical protein
MLLGMVEQSFCQRRINASVTTGSCEFGTTVVTPHQELDVPAGNGAGRKW